MNKKNEFNFYVSFSMAMVAIFGIAIIWGGVIVYILEPLEEWENLLYYLTPIGIGIIGIIATAIPICRWLSKVTISEYGLKKSLFGKFFKREVPWSQLKSVRKVWRTATWIFFSTSDLQGLSYEKMLKRKDTVSLELTPEVVQALTYFNKVGLIPDDTPVT